MKNLKNMQWFNEPDVWSVENDVLYMPENCPMQVGPVGASPDGNGFKAVFENFELTHLPDMRRLEWLNKK